MSFVRELERMQQSIRELSQCFDALKEATDRLHEETYKLTPPEYPNELRDLDTTDIVDPEPRQSIDEASPQEWDSASRKFYRNPKGG